MLDMKASNLEIDIFTLLISFFFKLDTNLTSPVSGSVVYGIELGTSLI